MEPSRTSLPFRPTANPSLLSPKIKLEYLLVDSIGVEGLATCCSIFGARSPGSNRVEILDTARDSVPRLQSSRVSENGAKILDTARDAERWGAGVEYHFQEI